MLAIPSLFAALTIAGAFWVGVLAARRLRDLGEGEHALGEGEVHLALGEVAMDSSNYTRAQEDFQACISLKKTALPADARSLAESFYQLGVCQAMSGKFPEAEASLTAAISVLEARSKNYTEESEELEEVVAEIWAEVEEHKVMQKEGMHFGKNRNSLS